MNIPSLASYVCSVLLVLVAQASLAGASGEACTDPEGTTRNGFIQPVTSGDVPCPQGNQVCIGGIWTGPTLFETCENYTKSCDGTPHGVPISGYLQPTTPKGVPCVPATKICLNGAWTGPEVFPSCAEM